MKLLFGGLWTEDCSGKKNYDGAIVSIDSRYWPDHTASARLAVDLPNGDYETIVEKDFSGSNFNDVAKKTEKWVQKQMDRVVRAIKNEFQEGT